jgi:L-fucose isomerase and related proteins
VACEGDLLASLAMLLARRLTGCNGWIANAVYGRGDEAVFAHCTVSLDMVKSWRLMPHFESGLPCGLAGELAHQLYTAVSISPRFDKAAVGRARLERGGNLLQHTCRTQAAFRFERAVKLEAEAPANHHVFMPGDVARRGRRRVEAPRHVYHALLI